MNSAKDGTTKELDKLLAMRYTAILEQLASADLDRLGGGKRWHASHKLRRSTAIAIVVNEMLGLPFDTDDFWKGRNDTCSRTTYEKYRAHDPAFVPLLDKLRAEYVPQAKLQVAEAISADAFHKIQLEALNNVDTLIEIRDQGEKDSDRLRAAEGMMDRTPRLAKRNITAVTGADGGAIETKRVGDLTDAEREAEMAAMIAAMMEKE